MLRSPIVTVLGHVDHGKSTLLDAIRGTNVASREAGEITQSIGASKLPLEVIKERAGGLVDQLGDKISLPGLLFVDTPGHAAFAALRQRGGSLADLAVLVVDITEGVKPQTEEAIEILLEAETPFVIAANKVDKVHGFDASNTGFLRAYNEQSDDVQHRVDQRVYEIVGDLHDAFGITAQRYDHVDDYRKSFAIVPCSATTNVGLGEVLFVLVGLAQRFLTEDLAVHPDDPGRGVILEVKEEEGMGKTLDVILHEGYIEASDDLLIGSLDGVIDGSIRSLFMPGDLEDSRDQGTDYARVDKAVAATGVKILSPEVTDDVVSGMPVEASRGGETARSRVESQSNTPELDLEEEGILIRADTLGGLEALARILREADIPLRDAQVGDITRKDLIDARSNRERNPEYAFILGFNVTEQDRVEGVESYTSGVIYELVDLAEDHIEAAREEADRERLRKLTPPAKIRVLRNCIFRKSEPCIVGIRVLDGVLHTGAYLMDERGTELGRVKSIQDDGENLSRATKGDEVAVSLPEADAEQSIEEEMILYTDLLDDEFKEYKDLSHLLNDDLKRVVKEIARIKREDQPLWGV